MITEVSDINLRQNLGSLLNQVEQRNDTILINKDGKPVAGCPTHDKHLVMGGF